MEPSAIEASGDPSAASRSRSASSGLRRRITSAPVVAAASVALLGGALSACGASAGGAAPAVQATSQVTTAAKAGGSFTMLEETGLTGTWPSGLDPATDTSGTNNLSYLDAIYGNLFELGPDGKNVPDLAVGDDVSKDGKTVTIHLRPGVKFSDGTSLDAAAVKWNWQRDLISPAADNPHWPVASIATSGTEDVVLHLTRPFAAIINSFHAANVNWIASPTAYQKMGEDAFKLKPVGAGPFTVVSDTVSSQLSLAKNPTYWKQGAPLLDHLTFKSVASDEAALEAMNAGQGDGYEGMQTAQLVSQFQKKFNVLKTPPTSSYVIQLNTQTAPFNNVQAREAIYYATDVGAIDNKLFGNQNNVTEGFTAPGGLFYSPTVPGYRTFDLDKAKAAVQAAGGVTVDLSASQSSVTQTVLEALQTMWQAAGIKVNIHVDQLPSIIQQFESNKWQASLQTVGSFDPATGLGVNFRFGSSSPFSGVKDPQLDALFAKAAGTFDDSQRKSLYDQAAKYISDKAYGPILFPANGWDIAGKNVSGPGLTTALPGATQRPEILWDSVGFTQ
jgi:peptide/nickel transport system substrate-binding protein